MTVRQLKLTVISLAIASALASAYALGHFQTISQASAATQPSPAAPPEQAGLASMAQPDMAGIVARNGPAVVNISVSGTRKVASGDDDLPQLAPGDPLYEFFRQFRLPRPGGQTPLRGQGSGFIVTADGSILTNAHVVEGADEITVKLTDKREFKATLKGLDKASDVAVLKIDARDLPTVAIGNSAATRVGDWVLAIGSPFGFENSASAGIISAKSRSLPDGSYVPFIQTDVAVNPGNSGGPLFNMAGQVIGINSQIYSRSGGYQGLSFAIPIEVAMNVEKQIVTSGKVERGRLGVSIQEVNQSLADSFGLPKPAGALVNSVEKDGPAARAGLEPGDVILAIDGKEIAGASELPAIVAGMAAGETAHLQVWRKGASREIAVRVGSFGDTRRAAAENTREAPPGRLGVGVRPLTPDEQRQAELSGGLRVESVGGAAARAGIRPGDIIVSVNGEMVKAPEQLRSLLAKAGKRVAILVERGAARIFIPVELG